MIPDSYRAAIESTYTDRCTIEIREQYKDGNLTKTREKVLGTDIPCRISFKSSGVNANSSETQEVNQLVELFISPDVDVPKGARVTVDRTGLQYSHAGIPALYKSHQQIMLKPWKRWS